MITLSILLAASVIANLIQGWAGMKLNEDVAGLNMTIETLRGDIRLMAERKNEDSRWTAQTLRRMQQELSDELIYKAKKDFTPVLTAIKFSARVPGKGLQKTLFTLGLGPCGKLVDELQLTESSNYVTIKQVCKADNEIKSFVYPRSDIEGRVERTYTTH